MKYIVVGSCGRLGKVVCEKLKEAGHKVVEIDKNDDLNLILLDGINAILDVSTAKNSLKTADFAKKHRLPLVIGATGHSEKELDEIKSCASQIPVLVSYNFSLGMSGVKKALKEIVKFNIEAAYITELHHKAKKDVPSGTAKELIGILQQAGVYAEDVFSKRQGSYIGEHTVELFMESERITIKHSVESRDCFANGAVKALAFIANAKAGLYNMEDIVA